MPGCQERARQVASIRALPRALVVVVLTCGCGRSSGKSEPASRLTGSQVTPQASVATSATKPAVGSAASAVTTAPTAARTFDEPSWFGEMPPLKTPLRYLARALQGPVPAGFEGLLICQYTVAHPSWDAIVSLLGHGNEAPPDVIAWIGDHGPIVRGPDNATRGALTLRGVRLEPAGSLQVHFADFDQIGSSDFIDDVTFDLAAGFPLQARTAAIEVTCAGVPLTAMQDEIAAREATLLRALDAMEKPPSGSPGPRFTSDRPRLQAAREATLALGAIMGSMHPPVRAAVARIEAHEQALGNRPIQAWSDAANQGADASGWIELPSARVRPGRQTKQFQLIVGAAGATYDARTKQIGPIALTGVTLAGERMEPAFVDFLLDGAPLAGRTVHLPPGKTVDVLVEMGAGFSNLYALVLEEGDRQVVLMP